MKEVLLVIDIQRGFSYREGYSDVVSWINENREYYDFILGVVFSNSKESPIYKRLGFDDCMSFDNVQVEYNADLVVVKQGYAFTKSDLYISKEDTHITVVGTDAECCVLATCFDLFEKGYDFNVLADKTLSSSEKLREEAFDVMRYNFGDNVLI